MYYYILDGYKTQFTRLISKQSKRFLPLATFDASKFVIRIRSDELRFKEWLEELYSSHSDDGTGWTIIPRTVTNLYWVGGSGNWNDPAHWSLTSGGPGGACIPSGTDNVFFDANSFTGPGQFVEIAVASASCRDITWTSADFYPGLVGGYDPVLRIFGSMTQIEEMNYWFGGLISFESQETGKTITTGNHRLDKVNFQGNGGEWTFSTTAKHQVHDCVC